MDRLARYIRHGEQVHGWLHQFSAHVIVALSAAQNDANISGACGEIGVHMGRLLILLALLRKSGEKCFAVDLFGDQHLNIDKSGFGDRETFISNVRKWTGADDIEIIQASSLDLFPTDIPSPCRLVSIDGGHTEECTLHDLRLIEPTLVNGGIIILDDFFHAQWPGVAAGASRYFLDNRSLLRPFLISPNKLYLAAPQFHASYQAQVRERFKRFYEKTVVMYGFPVDVFGIHPSHFSVILRLQASIGASAFGPTARRAKAFLRQFFV